MAVIAYVNERYYKAIVKEVKPPEKPVEKKKKHKQKLSFYAKYNGKIYALRVSGEPYYFDLKRFVEKVIADGSKETE